MPIYLHFIYSFFATIGFAIVFNVPKKSLFYGGFCGAVGWTLYTFLFQNSIETVSANFIASLAVALLGEIFARIDKKPVTAFVIPGIIPLVPGYGIYRTMLNLLQDNLQTGIELGLTTLFSSGAIAIGIIVVSSVARIFKTTLKRI